MCLVIISSMYVVVGCGEQTVEEPATPTVREAGANKKGNASGGGKMTALNPDAP